MKKHIKHHVGKFRSLGLVGYFKHMFLDKQTYFVSFLQHIALYAGIEMTARLYLKILSGCF
jgi:hypothetical protein